MTSAELQNFQELFNAYRAYVNGLREELEVAKNEVANLRLQLATKHEEVTLLQERLRNRDVAGAVVGSSSDAEVDAARAKITELMREIDNCIALLNV